MATPRHSFKTLFCANDGGALLKSAAISGSLHTSGIRSIGWMYFLGGFDKLSPEELFQAVTKNRVSYNDLVTSNISDPRNSQEADPTINNPLSQAEDSPWAKFFQNAELEKVINQDIERCYPDKEFFQEDSVRKVMSRILFIYAKVNYTLSYRQGMHELLAPIVYLLHHERNKGDKDLDPEDAQTTLNENEEKILNTLLAKDALEADAYFIFKNLMDITADWFAPVPPSRKGSGTAPADEEAATPVVVKCRRIQHVLLKNKDPEVHDHLVALKIEPQFYLLRWVRLLLGREFHSLDDLMIIWDAVFAHSPDLVLVDYICVAMLVFIREQLLERDSTGCLTRLMKYPPVEDVRIFIEQAQTLISNRLQKPTTIAHPSPPPPSHQPAASSPHADRVAQANHSHSHSPAPAHATSSPATSSSSSKSKAKHQTPTPKSPQGKALQTLNPAIAAVKHNINIDTTTTDVDALHEQLRNLRDTQLLVALRIDNIVHSIQQTLTTNAVQGEVDSLFLSLAELKQTKDILCGFLPATEVPSIAGIQIDEGNDDLVEDVMDHPLSDPLRRQVS